MQDDPPLRDDWNRCMICGQLAWDGFDFDWDGSTLERCWCYCAKCTCWTEHPPRTEPMSADMEATR